MLQPVERVTPFTPKVAEEHTTQMRHSIYLDEAAEMLYETAALCGRLADDALPWSRLPQSERATFRYEMEAALNRLSLATRYEAQLRAREHVALAHYGRDYHLLTSAEQREIKFIVQTAVETYSRVLEGVFTALPAFRALELEPTPEVQS